MIIAARQRVRSRVTALLTMRFPTSTRLRIPAREYEAPVRKHERFTPLSRPFSWQLPCERDDPIRTMLPCQHLVIFDAA